jgi:hypothetical protein
MLNGWLKEKPNARFYQVRYTMKPKNIFYFDIELDEYCRERSGKLGPSYDHYHGSGLTFEIAVDSALEDYLIKHKKNANISK